MVRKYIYGTRSRHGKIASITIDEESKGPDEKGVWTIKGSYVTDNGDKEPFTASVTSRGEVLLAITPRTQGNSEQRPSKFTKRKSRPSLKRNRAT